MASGFDFLATSFTNPMLLLSGLCLKTLQQEFLIKLFLRAATSPGNYDIILIKKSNKQESVFPVMNYLKDIFCLCKFICKLHFVE